MELGFFNSMRSHGTFQLFIVTVISKGGKFIVQ